MSKAPDKSRRRQGRRGRTLLLAAVVAAFLAGAVAVLVPLQRRSRSAVTLADLVSPAAAEGFNLLLVTLDTVRADHLGCYGCAEAVTPVIDGLCSSGVRFEQAVASTPLTLPSHATILTGLYPARHGARDNGRYRVLAEPVTLAESLRDRGYATAAFVGSFVLDRRYGLGRGFEIYDFHPTAEGYRPEMPDFNERRASSVTDSALAWLRGEEAGARRPFFAWLHYYDPHEPYQSPLQGEARFAGRPYDAEIAYVDAELGRVLAEIDRLGLRERTLVVVTADHGEAFGAHGEPTHGMLLYEPTQRVPLILSCGSLFRRGRVVSGTLAGLVDLAPTLRDLLGLPAVPGDGLSLLRAGHDAGRAVYLETFGPHSFAGWSPLHGLRTLRGKYILAPTPEFYDLARDPDETVDLHGRGGPEEERLERELADLMSGWGEVSGAALAMSDEEIERFASLGYLGAAGGPDGSSGGAGADPKEMMDVYRSSIRAEGLYRERRYAEAAELAAEVVSGSPGLAQAVRVLAFSRLRLGRTDEAIETLRRACAGRDDRFLLRSLAQVQIIANRFGDARETLRRYEAIAPRDGRIYLLRGDILVQEGHPHRALENYRKAVEVDPNRTGPMAEQRIRRLEAGGEG